MTWEISATACPHYLMDVHKINATEFVGVPSLNLNGIYKFNILNQHWTKIITYNATLMQSFAPTSSTYNSKLKLLYVSSNFYDEQAPAAIFDLNNNESSILQNATNLHFVCFDNNNQLHLISTNKNYRKGYYICSPKLQVIKLLNSNICSDFYTNFTRFSSIYLSKTKKVYIYGGFNAPYGGWQQKMYTYNCDSNDNQWKKLTIPKAIYGCAVVCTENEDFIIFLGGFINRAETYKYLSYPKIQPVDDILLLNCKSNQFCQSNIKCPRAGGFNAILMPLDGKRRDCLIHRFIFDADNEISPNKFHTYLINMIIKYYCNESIYLLNDDGQQWMINSDEIIWQCPRELNLDEVHFAN